MLININENIRIKTDGHQFILEHLSYVVDKKTQENEIGDRIYSNQTFHMTLQHTLEWILRENTVSKNNVDWDAMMKNQNKLLENIRKLFIPGFTISVDAVVYPKDINTTDDNK